MQTATLETLTPPAVGLKTTDVISNLTVAVPPTSAAPTASVAPATTLATAPPARRATPKLASKSAFGVTWRAVAVAAGITAVPVALKFLVRPKSKGGKIGLSMATSLASSLPWNYLFSIRPQLLYWGATVDEVKQTLPGDELVPEPQMAATYAVTINAPTARVWPWLVQIGQGRGGLYSYERLENMMHLNMHNANEIVPELQNLKVGDEVRLTPSEALALEVAILEPQRALVLCNPNLRVGAGKAGDYFKAEMNVSWAFVLTAIDQQTSRLLVRWHIDYQPNLPTSLVVHLMQEPAQFIMQRKMMLGIKQRAEQTS